MVRNGFKRGLIQNGKCFERNGNFWYEKAEIRNDRYELTCYHHKYILCFDNFYHF